MIPLESVNWMISCNKADGCQQLGLLNQGHWKLGNLFYITVAHLTFAEHGVQAPATTHNDHQLFSSAKPDPCEACHADITGFQSSHPRCHAVFGNRCATQGNTKLGLGIPAVALETTQQLTLDRLHAGNMIR